MEAQLQVQLSSDPAQLRSSSAQLRPAPQTQPNSQKTGKAMGCLELLIFFTKLFASDVFSSWAHLGLPKPSRSSTWTPSSAPARPSSRSSSAQIQLSSAEASSTETSPILEKLQKQWGAWNCSFSLRNSLPATFFRSWAHLGLSGRL